MKILLVCEFFPLDDKLKFTGGVEAYNYYLAKNLAKKNEVIVLCRKISLQKNTISSGNLRVISVGSVSPRIDTNIKTLPSRINFCIKAFKVGLSEDFDVVQGNNFVTYPVAFLIGLLKGKPKIAWYPDVFIGRWISLTGFFSGVVGEIAERIYLVLPWDRYVALSQSTRVKLLNAKIENDKIVSIYAGIDTDFLKVSRGKKNKIFTICCVCRLVNYKRVDLLIKALYILIKKKYDLKLNVIGEGPEKQNLLNLAKQLEISRQIKWESNLSRGKLGVRLNSADLFCMPSEQEGFGMVVIEAAAVGLPFVISDIEVFKEITKNGKGGLFFKKGNVDDFVNKIEKIIINPELENKLSKDALELSKGYSWPKIANEFENVYNKVIKEYAKRAI